MMETIRERGSSLGVAATCVALGVPPSSYYRHLSPPRPSEPKPPPARSLTPRERATVLEVLHEPRFADLPPGEVYARLLDEQRYLCSERTMYRILEANKEVRERRNQLRHPRYSAPELLAAGPNELWSWDITMLRGPAKWTYYYLYVILDVFSRSVVGWMVAHRESKALAKKLIKATCQRQGIAPGQLTLHADRGSSMKSKVVALLLSDLGVTKSHSRPHVSNDNPFSESQFKTMKYRPEFPDRFGSIEDARAFCQTFFAWYNTEHRHSGIAMLTPEDVHLGRAAGKLAARADVLEQAYAAHPERFVRGVPTPATLADEVWINPPKPAPAPLDEEFDLAGSPQIDDRDQAKGVGTPGNTATAAATNITTPVALH